MIKKKRQRIKYLIADYCTANVGWFVYDVLRYFVIGTALGYQSIESFLLQPTVLAGQLVFPLFWMGVFYYSGYYNRPFRKSRLSEFLTTLGSVLVGALIIFFVFILDDLPPDYTIYYKMLFMLIIVLFLFIYIPRVIITQKMTVDIHHRRIGFNTLIMGTGHAAVQLVNELNTMRWSLGHVVKGYCRVDDSPLCIEEKYLLGDLNDIERIIQQNSIEEVIIASDRSNYDTLYSTVRGLFRFDLPLQLVADQYDILTGNARMGTVYGTPLINISAVTMRDWEKNIKHSLDRIVALICLFVSLPVFVYITIRIRVESPGPVFYGQERVGLRGKPFTIWKFRSMYVNAEVNGPRLATEDDSRVTPFGRTMRKYRLDELPQFWNVLRGDMSFVGPRPERKFYVDQILEEAPFYYRIHAVRPGITSWGMVKFGYANSVKQMVQRLKYDLIYIESMSLLTDLKILIYTVRIIITGKGI